MKAVAFVVLVCVALGLLEVWREYLSYQADLSEAQATTLKIAKSLAQHAEDTVEIADALLVGVAQQVEKEDLGPAQVESLRARLVAQVREIPRIRGLFVYDERGDWLASTEGRGPAVLNNADRAYFKHHARTPDRAPLVGDPVESRSGGQWILTITRRLHRPDGSFAGVVLASVEVGYFSRFYDQFDMGPEGAVVLFRVDGTLLARSPHDQAVIGRSFSGSPLFRDVRSASEGTRRYVSPVDGVERISGYARTSRFGLVLQAAMSKDTALAAWRAQLTARGAGVGLLILVIGMTGLRLVGQVRLRERSESALGESESRFRLLAENSSDMVTRLDQHGRRVYVSPASERLLGWTPAELQDRPVLDGIHPEDRARLERLIDRLRSGDEAEATAEYRVRRRDGQELWLESALRVAHDAGTREPDGVVAVTRDVTERKDLEARLTSMARTDGLTGLANRRAFDEAFDQEWRRAEREGASLSLILLDIDCFKLFNDTYGHQAGDECLRLVAGAVAGALKRPGDLAARYGGEEIVLLLPRTDADGAATIAEAVRSAVQELALQHERNPPTGVVTASIGVATSTTVERKAGAARPEFLLEAADQALYRAKAGGRNRVGRAPSMLRGLATPAAA